MKLNEIRDFSEFDEIPDELCPDCEQPVDENGNCMCNYREDEFEDFENDDQFDSNRFAQPGSALHAADDNNPRIYPCPTCERENMLTPRDVAAGYQCDHCADRLERGW